jgi:hypothetical protein
MRNLARWTAGGSVSVRDPVEGVLQILRSEGFFEASAGSEAQGLFPGGAGQIARDDDYAKFDTRFAEVTKDIEARYVRQPQVEQHDIRSVSQTVPDGGCPVGGETDVESQILKITPVQLTDGVLVVYDQSSGHLQEYSLVGNPDADTGHA